MQEQIWLFSVRNAFHKNLYAKSERAIRLYSWESIFIIFAPCYVIFAHIALNAVICMIKNIFSLIMESWLLRDVGFYRSFIPFYVLRNLFNTKMSFICYSPAGRSVLGETVPEVLSTAWSRRPRAVLRPRAQFLPMRTDLSRWKTFLFFSSQI